MIEMLQQLLDKWKYRSVIKASKRLLKRSNVVILFPAFRNTAAAHVNCYSPLPSDEVEEMIYAMADHYDRQNACIDTAYEILENQSDSFNPYSQPFPED